jgi:putative alpha-1,2-mannosidase
MHPRYLLFLFLFLITCYLYSQQELIKYVNPFIGTQEMGHTYPGASVPFGMVQLSPDTDTIPYSYGGGYVKEVYRYCSGYQYDDPTITGFSHTHFSGTGHSDLGDFLVMPFYGEAYLNPGTADNPGSGYRKKYSKDKEWANPGYYAVGLENPLILAEMTATERVGIHRYTYPQEGPGGIPANPRMGT